jgi:hypothetical protein
VTKTLMPETNVCLSWLLLSDSRVGVRLLAFNNYYVLIESKQPKTFAGNNQVVVLNLNVSLTQELSSPKYINFTVR